MAYEYYKPLTTHDSSLSPAVHMLVANRLGMEEETEQFLDRTIAVDMELVRRGAGRWNPYSKLWRAVANGCSRVYGDAAGLSGRETSI